MTINDYYELSLSQMFDLLGDLEKPNRDLCYQIELMIIDLFRKKEFQIVADAVKEHQFKFGLRDPEKKLPRVTSFSSLTQDHPRFKDLTWNFKEINPIRRMIAMGELHSLKPLWRFFTGFTPSGLVVGSPPANYGKSMDGLNSGSAYSGIAAEGIDALIFRIESKKTFTDVIKMYGRNEHWLDGGAFLEIMRSHIAPLETFNIWSDKFTKSEEELCGSTEVPQLLAMPIYQGQKPASVIDNFVRSTLDDPFRAKRFGFWIDRLTSTGSNIVTVSTLFRCIKDLVVPSGSPETMMNKNYIETFKAISLASEALKPGTQHKVMCALLVGEVQLITDFTSSDLFRDLANSEIDRKALLQELDGRRVKSIEKYLGWPECLEYLGVKDLSKRFSDDLGL